MALANEKMPMKQLLAMRQKQREREAAERQFLEEIGAFVPRKAAGSGNKRRKSAAAFAHKKTFDRSGLADSVGSGERALTPALGKERGGTLRLSAYDIDTVLRPHVVAERKAARRATLEGRPAEARRGNAQNRAFARKLARRKNKAGGKKRKR